MERPEIENFILDGLPAAHAEYSTAPGLFRYAQSLENYIDFRDAIDKKAAINDFVTWLNDNYQIDLGNRILQDFFWKMPIESSLKHEPTVKPCDCSRGKGLDLDENGKLYCIDCGLNV